ncbi:MAG: PAS domain-containing sensor histidine kinase [Anaeromyxobacteraceae bacterium]
MLRSKVAAFAAMHRTRQKLLEQAEALRLADRRRHALALAELELTSLRKEQAAQQRYRALVEGISHAIVWVLDPVSLACRFVSPSAEALLGFPLERWRSEPTFWEARLPPADREAFRAAAAGLTPSGPGVALEHRLVRADGREAWFETALGLAPGDRGGPPELHGFSVDVTRAVQGREGLAFLARASAVLAEALDRRETARAAARVAVPFLGDVCVVDVAASDASPAETFVAHADASREAEAGAGAGAGAGALLEALGTKAALVVPLVARGRTLGRLSLFAENPARLDGPAAALAEELGRRAAQALDHALLYDDARAAVALREEFLSIASHELRTPLSALLMQAHLVRRLVASGRHVGAEGELLRRLDKELDQVNRITALVNSLFDLVRIRSGLVRLAPEPCDLAAIAGEVRGRFEEVLARADRALEVRARGPVHGVWDRGRLEQVLTNLVGNALKYGRGDVVVEVADGGDAAEVTVADHGPGIPPEDQARIFDRFERGGRKDGEGLGLGLYICRKVVEAHGGEISVRSEVGQGTTFTVRLPTGLPATTEGRATA